MWAARRFPETRAENIKIFDDYLTLCDKNNVRPIIFLPPVSIGYAKYFSKQMIDELRYLVMTAINKHSEAIFFDGWNLLKHFSDEDFADVDHLNFQGATKFSAIFDSLIEELEK